MNSQFNNAYQLLSDEDNNAQLIITPSAQFTKETSLMLVPDTTSSSLLVVDLSMKENIDLCSFVQSASVANSACDVAPLVLKDSPDATLTFSLESDCDPYRLFIVADFESSVDGSKNFRITLPLSTTADALLNALNH